LRGHQRQVVDGLRGLLESHPRALAPDDLMDHAPLPYATGLWNAHEDTRLH
jgi:hypothetical protein